MGIRIVLTTVGGEEAVDIVDDDDVECFYVSYAEFKAACCRDLGLVDPKDAPYPISQDDVDELCRKRMADKTRQAANHAADVLAAASRRLA